MKYKYRPKTKEELIKVIKKEIYEVQGTKKNPNWKADLNCIDTSLITDMSCLFTLYDPELEINGYDLEKFNGDISKWDVSNVEDMSWMFAHSKFNQDISKWNVSNAKNMEGMFFDSKFNKDISKWNISNVIDMSHMFEKSKFNKDISKWNVSNVKYMKDTFSNSKFNQDISNWNVSNVKNMSGIFEKSKFNGNISNWNVSNVENMSWMFSGSQFNQDISNWDVSNVTDMSWMFVESKFNGDISKWNVSNVEDMTGLFYKSEFNQNISNWNINNVKDMSWMFKESKFNQDIGSWPLKLKKETELKNISVSLEYNRLPDKIVCPETVANIFIRSINNPDNTFNIDNFKQIFKEFLNNRKELYKNKGYKPNIVNKLVLNDVTKILKHLKDKDMQKKFMEITINKCDKKSVIDIVDKN